MVRIWFLSYHFILFLRFSFVFVEELLSTLFFGTFCRPYSLFFELGYFYVADYSLIGILTGRDYTSRISAS